jgi:hypothetical protein
VCVCFECISGPHLQARHLVIQSRKLATGGAHLITLIGINGAPHLHQTGVSCAAGACCAILDVTQTQQYAHARTRIYIRGELLGWQELCGVYCGVARVRQRLSCQQTGAMRTHRSLSVCVCVCVCACVCAHACVCVCVNVCVRALCVCARAPMCALSGWRHTHQIKRAIISYSLERSILQRRDALPDLALDRRLRRDLHCAFEPFGAGPGRARPGRAELWDKVCSVESPKNSGALTSAQGAVSQDGLDASSTWTVIRPAR